MAGEMPEEMVQEGVAFGDLLSSALAGYLKDQSAWQQILVQDPTIADANAGFVNAAVPGMLNAGVPPPGMVLTAAPGMVNAAPAAQPLPGLVVKSDDGPGALDLGAVGFAGQPGYGGVMNGALPLITPAPGMAAAMPGQATGAELLSAPGVAVPAAGGGLAVAAPLNTHGESEAAPAAKPKKKRIRERTPRLIKQNQNAQRRYRERLKQKAKEQTEELERLRLQVQGMKTMEENQNALLKELMNKEQQIQNLKNLITSGGVGGAPAEDASIEEIRPQPGILSNQDDRIKKLQDAWMGQLVEIKNVIESSGAGKSDEEKMALQMKFHEACILCYKLKQFGALGPAGVKQSLETTMADYGAWASAEEERVWTEAVVSIDLTPAQKEACLQMRDAMLKCLDETLESRVALRAQVVEACHSWQSNLENLSDKLESNGAGLIALGSKGVGLLESLRANILTEFNSDVEMNYKLMYTVLQPAQSAQLMASIHPNILEFSLFSLALVKLQG